MNTLGFLLRMLRRDARAGELHLLVAALVIAVAALTAVGFFTDRVRQALLLEANQLLGADTADLIKRYPKAQVRDFDGNPDRLTEMDALVAYLQVLGTMVDVNAPAAQEALAKEKGR